MIFLSAKDSCSLSFHEPNTRERNVIQPSDNPGLFFLKQKKKILLNYLLSHLWDLSSFVCSSIHWTIFSLHLTGSSAALGPGPFSPWNTVFLLGLLPCFPLFSPTCLAAAQGPLLPLSPSTWALNMGYSWGLILGPLFFCAPWTISSPGGFCYHLYAVTPKLKSSPQTLLAHQPQLYMGPVYVVHILYAFLPQGLCMCCLYCLL